MNRNRIPLATAGLLVAWMVHDVEELLTMSVTSRTLVQQLPDWMPGSIREQGLTTRYLATGIATIGLIVTAAAVRGYRTQGRSAFYQNTLLAFGLHGFGHIGLSLLTRSYTSGVATAPMVVAFWLWATRALQQAGVPSRPCPAFRPGSQCSQDPSPLAISPPTSSPETSPEPPRSAAQPTTPSLKAVRIHDPGTGHLADNPRLLPDPPDRGGCVLHRPVERVASSTSVAAMDGLVELVTARIARPADQGSHGRGQAGGRHSPWGSHQRVTDRDPTRGNRADHGVDAGLRDAHHRERSHPFGHAWAGHVDLAGTSRGGDAAHLHLDPLTRIRYPRDFGRRVPATRPSIN